MKLFKIHSPLFETVYAKHFQTHPYELKSLNMQHSRCISVASDQSPTMGIAESDWKHQMTLLQSLLRQPSANHSSIPTNHPCEKPSPEGPSSGYLWYICYGGTPDFEQNSWFHEGGSTVASSNHEPNRMQVETCTHRRM